MTDNSPVYKRILLAYDGSENAKRALHVATELARRSQGEVAIIVVADTLNLLGIATGPPYMDFREEVLEHANTLISEASDRVRNDGVSAANATVEEGHPANKILAKAVASEAELIVLGRRGIRGIERFLLGSVSSSVVAHSECDVLVVK